MEILLPKLGDDGCILEGLVTTTNIDGSLNVSPMGPIVDHKLKQFFFRPYQTSRTYQNLKRNGGGVFHVTDDVMLIAQAALGQPDPAPEHHDLVLTNACRWFRFQVRSIDDSEERTEIVAETIESQELRPFFGFNRAKHAVLEAAILATRVHLVDHDTILSELQRLEVTVQKTASKQERLAFEFVQSHIRQSTAQPSNK